MQILWTLIFTILFICASVNVVYSQQSSEQLHQTNVYTYLAPLTVALILAELVYLGFSRKRLISFQEAIANLGTALGNQTMNVLIAASVYVIYGWLWTNFRVATIELNVYTFIILLLLMDFFSYWVHRWGHAINVLWAIHSPHHSAEEMNIFVGLRASVTQRVFTFAVLWPLTIIGFTPFDIYVVNGIHLFIALIQHVTFAPKFERLGKIFNTPSHHRVHHAMNAQYLDKNFSDFLIIWDRVFGTFEPERETPVYGMYHPPRSWNPLVINFHFFRILWRDAAETRSYLDKFRVWFMPAGWRPCDLAPRPAEEITLETQTKYRSPMFLHARWYLILHAAAAILFTVFVISDESRLSTSARWIGGLLVWFQICNWGGILEGRRWAWIAEATRLGLTLSYLLWVSASLQFSMMIISAIIFSVLSAIWTLAFFRPGAPVTKPQFKEAAV